MAGGATVGPYVLTGRYEALAGDPDERVTLYYFLRYLGLTADQARALPWWQYRMYCDELDRDRPWLVDVVQREPGEDDQMREVGSDSGSLASMGIPVREVG